MAMIKPIKPLATALTAPKGVPNAVVTGRPVPAVSPAEEAKAKALKLAREKVSTGTAIKSPGGGTPMSIMPVGKVAPGGKKY